MKVSAFSINMVFIVLMLAGIVLLPKIPLQLMPSSRSNELSVSFSWPHANPEMLEMEVTSKLEGAFARTKGLNDIRSYTSQGSGSIVLSIDKNENIDAVKLYLSSLLRSLAKEFPEGVRIGTLQGGESRQAKPEDENEERLLMSYTITGPGTSLDVATYAEDQIVPLISGIEGIERASVTGAVPFEEVLLYDEQALKDMQVSPYEISAAIGKYYSRREGGKVLLKKEPTAQYAYCLFMGHPGTLQDDFLDIPIKSIGNRIIHLRDLVKRDYCEARPASYFRINGLNRININVFCLQKSNMVDLANKVRAKLDQAEKSLASEYSLTLLQDNSKELKNELRDNLFRTLLTVVILLVFVWITSRSLRYLAIITICLAANILIAMVFYYLFGIEIHLYALAGITVSFGIIIDNVIVMTDHYRYHHDRKVFMAILAATLTTMGALIVIFNMDNEIMRNMWGFSAVIIINLMLSVVIALLFVPALMEKLPLPVVDRRQRYRQLRRSVKITAGYKRVLLFLQRHRKLLVTVIVLGFGIPVFLIPTSIERDRKLSILYNRIFGSEFFLTVKPWLDKGLGGSLRLFIEGGGGEWRQNDPETKARTTLNLTMTMPHGATLEQMNEAFVKVEGFLAGFEEIETFTTDVTSANVGRMRIVFKKEEEMGGAPERIKNELIRFANTIGNADSDISGVGRGFSNRTSSEYRSESLKVVGYNYRQVMMYAEQLKEKLSEQKRVKKLYIGSDKNPVKNKEFTIEASKEKLAHNNTNIYNMLSNLNRLSGEEDVRLDIYAHGEAIPVVIRPQKVQKASLWEVQQTPLQGQHSVYRLKDVGAITEEQAFETITKTNQEYEVTVQYDFIGDYMLSNKVKERVSQEMNREMPIGFRVKEGRDWGRFFWEGAGGIDMRIWYILLVIGIIYFICAILLESLRQALVVILIAPISFIGCFLGFYFFGFQFNEGGLAAFIMMCGLSVNAILYIINDYNNRVKAGKPRGLDTYLKAWNAKIIPILLTIVSTMLGFIPFLIGEVNDFWFSLAIGTMSGLAFSLLVLMGVLPVMFKTKNSKL